MSQNRIVKLCAAFGVAAALAAGVAGPAQAATAFDGRWSVKISAETGNCFSYTVPIEVADGQISYSGRFSATASGEIGAGGTLNVSFARKDDLVQAKGSLQDRIGYGSWQSPTKDCAGTWVARKA